MTIIYSMLLQLHFSLSVPKLVSKSVANFLSVIVHVRVYFANLIVRDNHNAIEL